MLNVSGRVFGTYQGVSDTSSHGQRVFHRTDNASAVSSGLRKLTHFVRLKQVHDCCTYYATPCATTFMIVGEISVGNGQARVRCGQALVRQEPFRAPVRDETRRVHGHQQVSRVVVRAESSRRFSLVNQNAPLGPTYYYYLVHTEDGSPPSSVGQKIPKHLVAN